MYIELTLRAVADRDESCNLFTYTERFNFPVDVTQKMFTEKMP